MLFASLSQHIRTSGASKTAQTLELRWPNELIVNLCSALTPQCEASNNQTCRQASARRRASGRESPQSGHGHGGRRSHGVRSLAGSRALVRKFLPRDSELGDELVDMPGRGGTHRHNSLQGSPLAHCAVQDSGGGAPHGQQTHRRQGPHGAWCSQEYKPAVGYSSQLTKGIMVISEYFWSLYKLSLLWWHFLSWNLEPKALSSWSAEDSQIAKYLVMD